MATREVLKRYIVLVIGLFIMAFGISLSTKANLGTSPISCVPYVLSLGIPFTMGEITIAMHIVFIVMQIVLLRRDFQPIQLLQLLVAVIFGIFNDFTLFLVSGLSPSNYVVQWILCLISCVIIAFGVNLEVKANVTMLSGEGLMLAISRVFHKEFGKVKVCFDCSLVIIGVIISFYMLHNLQGIREGTIVAALLIGIIVRFYSKKLTFIDCFLEGKAIGTSTEFEENMSKHNEKFAITIGREFGSGGHRIGQMLAKELGIAFYDKELIDLVAIKSGLTPEYVKEHEQKMTNSLLYDIYKQNYAYINKEMPLFDSLFIAQSQVIRNIFDNESCVIVGRCANYILRNHPHCFHVFIHSDKEHRIERIVKEYGIASDMAETELQRIDTNRKNHYKYYTGEMWGLAKNYHLTIDSSIYGEEETVNLIIKGVHKCIGD